MKVILERECCAYTLIPVNKHIAARMIRETGEESVLFQSDWDYPSLASALGWRGLRSRKCDHNSTDGTVNCPDCGKTAHSFITEADEWLSNHCGDTFNKPVEDYFFTAQ